MFSARESRWFAFFSFVAATINTVVLVAAIVEGDPWWLRFCFTASLVLIGILNLELADAKQQLTPKRADR